MSDAIQAAQTAFERAEKTAAGIGSAPRLPSDMVSRAMAYAAEQDAAPIRSAETLIRIEKLLIDLLAEMRRFAAIANQVSSD